MTQLKIGNVILPHGLILAPMAGVTDTAFRLAALAFGAEYIVSEMVSAKAICYDDKNTGALMKILPDERPMAVQIFGSEPEVMAEAAKIIEARNDAPDVIDINMGCPVKKIVSNGEGSALARSPEAAGKVVRAVKDSVKLPVTVKFRSGWDLDSVNAVEVAIACETNGADAVCVHGRTRQQFYADPVDLDIIAKVKKAVKIPVIGNGGINSSKDALNMYARTGCDGIAIARGAMGNPWLFEEISAALDGRPYSPPDNNVILKTALHQLEVMLREKSERTAIHEGRRQMSYYIKGVRGAAAARGELMKAETKEEICEIMTSVLS